MAPPMPKRSTVKIEAQFDVGEYQIVILSATEADGARALAAPEQVQDPRRAPSRCSGRTSRAGSKFFVAKVDPKKVKIEDGRARAVAAALPLRQRGVRAADPARPGELVGQAGPDRQHPLARQALRGRELQERRRSRRTSTSRTRCATRFAEFYAALFDKTAREEPGRGRHRVRVDDAAVDRSAIRARRRCPPTPT